MKVKDLIVQLKNLKPELQDIDIYIIAENGILMTPEIKFSVKHLGCIDKTKENVECIVLTHG